MPREATPVLDVAAAHFADGAYFTAAVVISELLCHEVASDPTGGWGEADDDDRAAIDAAVAASKP